VTVYLYLRIQNLRYHFTLMLRSFSYIVVFLILIFRCNNATVQQSEETEGATKTSKAITEKDIESFRFYDYGLSNDSKKGIENWQKYWELNEQIDYLKKVDFSFFDSEKAILKAFLNDLKTEMPEAIKTAPILSRITALETKLLKLNSTLKLDNADKTERLNDIKEFLIAMSNLNLQINKKFELEANLVDKGEITEQ